MGKYPVPDNNMSKYGTKYNTGVKQCGVSPYFDCYDRVELGKNIQPSNQTKRYELNPQAYTDKIARGFDKVPTSCRDPGMCNPAYSAIADPSCSLQGCNDPAYISMDPRLYSATRTEYLVLDRPPISGNVKLRDIYEKKYDDYGNGFEPYETIKDGQVVYYIDDSTKDMFYEPVYSEPAEIETNLYKNPMGSTLPEYIRKPLINTENPTTTTPTYYPYCLSYIQDSQSFREDLMSKRQWQVEFATSRSRR
jgi:hypothetical protein